MKKSLIPSLRFKDNNGKDYPDWQQKKLGEVLKFQDGYAFLSKNFVEKGINTIQVVRITDINNKNQNQDKIFVSRDLVEDLKLEDLILKEGDLLLSLTGAAGFNFFLWNKEQAILNQRTLRITPKNLKNKSLLYLIEPLIYQKINKLGTGQNNNLSKGDLKPLKILLPSLAEQEKIADCLSSSDELIEASQKKVAVLKQHKKGLMQKLFSQEVRFKDNNGKNYPDWKEKKLGEVCERIKIKNKNCNNVLTASGEKGLVNQEKFFSKRIASKNLSNYLLLKKGDFAYNRSSSTGYPFGAIKKLKLYDEGVVSSLYIAFRIIAENSNFMEFYFDTESFNKSISQVTQEGARSHGLLNVSVDDFFNIFLQLPSLPEQQKIADCLSSLDELIEASHKKVETLQQHKKGLMQKLFPMQR